MALCVIVSRSRTYVAGVLQARMPVLIFRKPCSATTRSHNRGRRLLIGCFATFVVACGGDSSRRAANARANARDVAGQRDDFGRRIDFSRTAHRVVSLNPTTTETIFAIGAGDRLIGRSHWDEWPAQASAVADLGDGIGPSVEAVLAARPDLVVLYASEDNRPAAERLESAGIRTISLRIDRIADFNRAIAILGRILDASAAAKTVGDSVSASLTRVAAATHTLPRPSVVWPLMDTSPMVVGGGSFINELLQIAGARNVYGDTPKPSPVVSMEDLVTRNPDLVIRGGEGGSTALLPAAWNAVPAVAAGRIVRIPLTLVLRPSVQMGTAATIIARALHPGLVLP